MNSTRENGLDLMRPIAALFIVCMHCSSLLILHDPYPQFAPIAVFLTFSVLAKAGVSFFFLVSGAFVLSSSRTQDLGSFYKKTVRRLVIPTAVFTVLYFAVDLAAALISGSSVADCFQTLLCGRTGEHLWFMYVLTGLYLAAPMVQYLKDRICFRTFTVTAVVLVMLGFFGEITAPHYLVWDPAYALRSLGVFMLGYSLYEKGRAEKSLGKAIMLLVLALMAGAGLWAMLFLQPFADIPVLKDLFSVKDQSPVVIGIGLLLTAGMLKLPVRKDFSKAASLSYGVYLVHVLILTAGIYIYSAIKNVSSETLVLSIPEFLLLAAFVGILSFALTALFRMVRSRMCKNRV